MSKPGKNFRGRGRRAEARKLRRTKNKERERRSSPADEGATTRTTEMLAPPSR